MLKQVSNCALKGNHDSAYYTNNLTLPSPGVFWQQKQRDVYTSVFININGIKIGLDKGEIFICKYDQVNMWHIFSY
jgi:hypothetical protein